MNQCAYGQRDRTAMQSDDILQKLQQLDHEQAAIDARKAQVRQEADARSAAERAEAIAAVNELIESFALTSQELFPRGRRATYIGPWGERWDGVGVMPDWMRRALRAGRTKADFLAAPSSPDKKALAH